MMHFKKSLAAGVMALGLVATAHAAEPFKVGFIGSMTGPLATLSKDIKDGFDLALKERGGKLGDVETVVVYGDDQMNPDVGKQVYERMSKNDKVDVITGMAFTNSVQALAPAAAQDKIFFLTANAGPKEFAGAQCNYYYFNPIWHTSALSEAAGRYVNDKGYKRVFMLAPNYKGGIEHIDGFKSEYEGKPVGQALTKIGQLDYSVEIGQIRVANPDAVFFALWGPMAINFLKQLEQAGLKDKVDLVTPGFAVDADSLPAIGDAALGIYNMSQWSPDLDNAANKAFVESYQKAYGRPPSIYASQGYEVALLLDAAVRDSKGQYKDDKVLHDAMMAANYDSIRGDIKFGPNQNIIQNVYLRQVVKNDNGQLTNKLANTAPAYPNQQDPYGAECTITTP